MTETDFATEDVPEAQPRNLKLWIATGAAAVAFIVLAIVFNSRFGVDPRVVESPLIGLPAPNVELEYIDQEGTLAIDDLKGEIVPHLTAAAEDYESQGVHFVGIATSDKRPDTIRFLDTYGWWTNYSYLDDPDARAGVEFGTFGVPETFVIDREGLVTHKFTGPITYNELTAELNRVLAGTGS
jgi:cytochrome c biogenesis protein CcmG/thiol:disulfide interchange protein DsbE